MSWKCYTSFRNLSEPGQKAVKLREELLGKKLIQTSRKISKWYKNKINLIELEKNIDVTDTGLEYQISRFQDERVLKSTQVRMRMESQTL